jgi:ketosteroid isomerase-like protein
MSGHEETVRRILDAFDQHRIEPVIPLIHPDVEVVSRLAALEGRSYRCRTGMSEWLRDLEEAWSEFGLRWENAVFDGDVGVAVYRLDAVMRDSGIAIEQQVAMHVGFREGMLAYARVYGDPREAFDAAGLTAPS